MVEKFNNIDQGSDLWLQKWGFDADAVLTIYNRFVAQKKLQIIKNGKMPFDNVYWHLKDVLIRLLAKQQNVQEYAIRNLCEKWAADRAKETEKHFKSWALLKEN